MRIELMTMWYNEEFLAPYFLNHYSWVDRIHVIIDSDTNDETEKIARQYDNVVVDYITFPDKLDDIIKVNKFNDTYRSLDEADYVILVDSDEFIFCNTLKKSVREHLEETSKNVYFVNLWQIYEHKDDLPLSLDVPIPYLRRHGDPDMNDPYNKLYIKPIVVKGGKDLKWMAGNHAIYFEGNLLMWDKGDPEVARQLGATLDHADMLQGSHWRLVDLEKTIYRRIHNRKNRLSQVNLARGMGRQYQDVAETEIVAEFRRNMNRPVVIHSEGFSLSKLADTVEAAHREDFETEGRKRSLDLGCGSAPTNPFHADEVYGVDSETVGGHIRKADLTRDPIPYADASFDFVSAQNFLERIPRTVHTTERRNPFVDLMNEVYRVLKPGGFFLAYTAAYPQAGAFSDPSNVNVITEQTFAFYFDDVHRWAAPYGYTGYFRIQLQEWRENKLLTVLQKVLPTETTAGG